MVKQSALASQMKSLLFLILLLAVEILPSSELKQVFGYEYRKFVVKNFEDISYADVLINTTQWRKHDRIKRNGLLFPLRIMTFNVLDYASPKKTPLNPTTKKDKQRAERGKAIANIILADNIDVVALQELIGVDAAPTITLYLNELKKFKFYDFIQNSPRSEQYAFIYRTDIIQKIRTKQFLPLIYGSFTQLRPPFAVEFRLSSGGGHLDFTIATIHTSPDSSSTHTTRWEIDAFYYAVISLLNRPDCFSANLIVLGDFNQSPTYVLKGWQSEFDKKITFLELSYTGSSSANVKDVTKDNRLDRIYVYEPFIFRQVVQTLTTGGSVFVNRMSPYFYLSNGKKASDHFPLTFILDMGKLGETFYHTECLTSGNTRRRREASENNACLSCLTTVLTGGVYPPGSQSSTQAFSIPPSPVRRGDANFIRFDSIIGSAFIFVDSERNASWCGSPGRECLGCRGVSDVSILNQCSDRIMCPILVDKMFDLFQKLQDCIGKNRSIIIHEAWDEPDSVYPNGESPVESLHSSGQEAKISLSVPLEEIIIEKDYDSDPSLLDKLASLAVCVGFEFVKINSVSNTVSVAVSECFGQKNVVPLCREPFLAKGRYFGSHEGPLYRYFERIDAICQPGYRLEGQITRTCVGEDEWSGPAPTCVKQCNDLSVPFCAEAVFDYAQGSITFQCKTGCIPSPGGINTPLFCNPDTLGFKGTNTFSCVGVDANFSCTIPPPPYNGYSAVVYGDPGEAGSVVEFSCVSGSTLVGHALLTCQANGVWSHNLPTCTSNLSITELNVPGFVYLTASVPINPLIPATLGAASYNGRLQVPYPPLATSGTFNTSINRIVLGESITLPFGGLTLAYRVEVDPFYLQIVQRYFYGRLEKPIFIEVIGNYDGINCQLNLDGEVRIPTEDVNVTAAVTLIYCNNCSQICSAQAVSLSVGLGQPWNISLTGSYKLAGNITTVSIGGTTYIQGIDTDVFATVQNVASQFSLEEFSLIIHLPAPLNLDIHGIYSKTTGVASFLGSLSLAVVDLAVSFTADIKQNRISSIDFSGSLSSPFTIQVEGSYKLSVANLSYLILTGKIDIEKFLNLSLTAQLQLTTRSLSMYVFYASIGAPLETQVSARYESLESDLVDMMGSIRLAEGYSIMVIVHLNISSTPVSIGFIELNGVFPRPLEVVSFKGKYYRQCSCAVISGTIVQDDFSLTLSTKLIFIPRKIASINMLNVTIQFDRPLSLRLDGQYMYSNKSTGSAVLTVNGEFEIPYISLNAMVLALLEGMSSVEVLKFHFIGTFPPPLGLVVMGDIESKSKKLILSGSLAYTYASLNASTTYLFMDDMHNQSAMLSDISLMGRLTSPFQLAIFGQYTFATTEFALGGMITVNEFLNLAVDLTLDTSSSPPTLDTIHMSGSLMTPIHFQTDFKGTYESQTQSAMLSSTLMLRSVTLNANAELTHLPNNSFKLQSINIKGVLDSPLAIQVTAAYIPTRSYELLLTGIMEIGSVSFVGMVHTQAVNGSTTLMLNEVIFTGIVKSPFMLMLKAVYKSGNLLMLSNTLDFTQLHLSVTALVNISKVPREITSYTFEGSLNSPFSGVVSAVYTSGDLVLHGMIDLASLHFNVEVIFDTSVNLTIDRVLFTTVFNPLNLMLVGTYNRVQQRMDLVGIIRISSPSINITVAGAIDLTQERKSLSGLSLSLDFHNPPLHLSGVYRMEGKNIQLTGLLPLGTLQLMATTVVSLGNSTSLDVIQLTVNYTIPFGTNYFFILRGTYNTATNDLFYLEGSITQGASNELVNALLVLSSTDTPKTRVVSLYIQEINIGALLRDYLGINWPSSSFPLLFRRVAVYKSKAQLTYDAIPYKPGYHARGEVKIFFLPTIIVDASMITEPHKRFELSFTLQKVIDWSVIVLCSTTDGTQCGTTGPSLAIQYEPDTDLQTFKISGGFELFGVRIGNLQLKVMKMLTSASLTLSESLKNTFLGILPETITLYWGENGFHTNLQIPELRVPDFKFKDVSSPSICSKLSGYLSELAIDVPFDLHGSLLVRLLENGSISLGAAINGSARIEIVDQTVFTASINLFVIEIVLSPGEKCSWQCFVDGIVKGIKNAGPMIVDQLLSNPKAVAAITAGKLGQRVTGAAATAVCDAALESAAEAAAAAAATAVGTAATLTTGAVSTVTAFGCIVLKLFGGCGNGGGGGGGDHDDEIRRITEMLGQTCGENSLCDQICSDDSGMIECSCNGGYYLSLNGYTCIRYDRCENENPCSTHAICMDPPSSDQITCVCMSGFEGNGQTCNDINECDNAETCPVHSTCVNSVGSHRCDCDAGYSKDSGTCEDIDECSDGTANCPIHSYCINTDGSYQCHCNNGFAGNDSYCTDINECLSADRCGPHSTCQNTVGSYNCLCNNGYKWNGTQCIDIDECSSQTPCDMNALCSNTDGSYYCTCMTGYAGNGTSCSDIDECVIHEDNCDEHAVCTNMLGSFMCSCATGFSGNGTHCHDIDECDMSLYDCALMGASCVNTIGSYDCVCLPGYSGNGTVCEDVDECTEHLDNCDGNATCMNTMGDYSCKCGLGYEGDGFQCTDVNECLMSSACDPFATCKNTLGSYHCTCNYGYTAQDDMCTLVSCGPLGLPPHSHYTSNKGSFYGQSVVVQCLPGYIPQGEFKLTCEADGLWNGSLPTCVKEIPCPEPNKPLHGQVSYATPMGTPHVGSIILYSCDFGYKLDGDSMAMCLESGIWSISMPKCVANLTVNDLYPFGHSAGDTLLPKGDDDSVEITLPNPFPFYNKAESNLFILINGLITFQSDWSFFLSSLYFPAGLKAIAPFWADVDTSPSFEINSYFGSDEIGNVWYRQDTSSNLLQRATDEIRAAFIEHSSFSPTWLLIVTWDKVGYFYRHVDKLNTFQCVLATDGRYSFVTFFYPRGGVQWTTGDSNWGINGLGGYPAAVGFNAGDWNRHYTLNGSGTHDVINIDERSNTMTPGVYIYQVDGDAVFSGGCQNDVRKLQISPLTVSSAGGSLITITGPCFEPNTEIQCTFGYSSTTTGVVSNMLRAYCPVPQMDVNGWIYLRVSIDGISYYSYLSTESLQEGSRVNVSMPGVLLHYDGDPLTLQWNPSNVVLEEVAHPSAYPIGVEAYVYSQQTWKWELYQTYDTVLENSGEIQLTSFPSVPPEYTDPIALVAFRIVANDSEELPEFIRSAVQQKEIGIWSYIIYKVTQSDYREKSPMLCQNWHTQNENSILRGFFPSCPCRTDQARMENSGFSEITSTFEIKLTEFLHPGAATCFRSTARGWLWWWWWWLFTGGQECCYGADGLLVTGPPSGGTQNKWSSDPLWWYYHHIDDIIPRIHCCNSPGAGCSLYYDLRPSDDCSGFNPSIPGFLFGDPHMITLDGLQYTFNGAGEFVILEAFKGAFLVQARTEPAERVDGGSPLGTAFTAIAAKTNDSDVVEVQRSSIQGVNILVNGVRLMFSQPTEWKYRNVTIRYEGNDTVGLSFSGGGLLKVQRMDDYLLIQVTSLPPPFFNNTQGLLGVWNSDPNDDLRTSDGNVLSPNVTMREIFYEFGEKWRINGSESLFTYNTGENYDTYNQLTFTPVFDIMELPFINMTGMDNMCGDNIDCLFDVGATGRMNVGQMSMDVMESYKNIQKLSQPVLCDPPCNNGAPCVNTNVCNCPLMFTGSLCETDIDECTLEMDNCPQQCNNTYGSYECTCFDGYNSSAGVCIDIDECQEDNGGCRCDPHFDQCDAICTNLPGSFECSCSEDYRLGADNRTCIVADVSTTDNRGLTAEEAVGIAVSGAVVIAIIAIFVILVSIRCCKKKNQKRILHKPVELRIVDDNVHSNDYIMYDENDET